MDPPKLRSMLKMEWKRTVVMENRAPKMVTAVDAYIYTYMSHANECP